MFKKILKNQLIAGSFVLFVGSMFASFGTYLYHLLMGRMLGPIDYGVLASLISLFYLLSIPMTAFSLVVVRYVSALKSKREKVNYFVRLINKKTLIISLVGLLIFFTISPWISSFLHLESMTSLIIIGFITFTGIFTSINLATLQGFLRFGWYTLSNIVGSFIKLMLAVILVYLGYKVFGAVLALLIGVISSYVLTRFYVQKVIGEKEAREGFNGRDIVAYFLPVFFSILAFTSLYTTDVVLVRHFLSAQEAGFYAALANLGKIIYFASSPIIMVMFPMVSERHANGKKYANLLSLSFVLALLVCLGISGIYFLFPKLMVVILYGNQYIAAAPNLFIFAIFLTLYSLSYLLVNFYLSIKKVKIVVLPIIAATLQIILIFFLHQNLTQVIWVSITVLSLLLIILLIYYLLGYGEIKKAFTFRYRSRL